MARPRISLNAARVAVEAGGSLRAAARLLGVHHTTVMRRLYGRSKDRAPRPLCSIEGCNGAHHARGLCQPHYNANWRDGDAIQIARDLCRHAKARAARSGVEFDLVPEDIIVPDVCPLLGVPLVRGKLGPAPTSPSLDRIDPTRGYVKDNVWVISHRANRIKGDATYQELVKLSSGLMLKVAYSRDP